eukprot:29413_1
MESKTEESDDKSILESTCTIEESDTSEKLSLNDVLRIHERLTNLGNEQDSIVIRMKEINSEQDLLNERLSNCLCDAAKRGDVQYVRDLCVSPPISPNCSENSTSNTPLHCAVIARNYAVVRYLLSLPEIKVTGRNKEGRSLLACAVRNGDTQMLNILLEHPKLSVNKPDND